jgi:hypothetical protein
MVNESGQEIIVKVIDFGLAKAVAETIRVESQRHRVGG